MKNIVLIGIACIAVLGGSSLLAQENKGPKIEARELQYNLGNVVQGTQASHIFEIRNTGNEPLSIDRVQSS